VVRKHARRAVKAAFAVALAIPIVLGGTANAGTNGTTITVGTKNFTEAFVLGQLYKQALEAKGYKVAYKENIGSSELLDTALTSGKINFAPEYTGVVALNLAKAKNVKTAAATYAAAKAFEEKRASRSSSRRRSSTPTRSRS
jgi:osmoprotectant transport system substrate-binding protein